MSERLTEKQQRVVEANIRMAYMMAHKYRPPYGMDFDDWKTECLIQLARAVMFHDPAKGTLSTILDRLVFNVRRNINSLNRSRKRGYGSRVVSSDDRGRNDCSLSQFFGRDHDWSEIENRDLCEQMMRFLDAKELQVIQILAEGCTQREIGSRLGFTHQRANELITRSREKLADRFPECLIPAGKCVICDKHTQRYGRNIVMYCTSCSKLRRNLRNNKKKKPSSPEQQAASA